MSKQKKQAPPPDNSQQSLLPDQDRTYTDSELMPKAVRVITMADVARILATPDDVLMSWFRAGQEEAKRMKGKKENA